MSCTSRAGIFSYVYLVDICVLIQSRSSLLMDTFGKIKLLGDTNGKPCSVPVNYLDSISSPAKKVPGYGKGHSSEFLVP